MTNLQPPQPNLWERFTRRERPSVVVDYPAFDEKGKSVCQVLIRCLTQQDHIAIQSKAMKETDKLFHDEGIIIQRDMTEDSAYRVRYDNIAAKYFIFEFLRDPENPTLPFAPTPDHIGKLLPNEVTVLMKHYQTLQDKQGTIIAYMSSEEMDAKITELAEAAERGGYFLDRFLREALDQLLMYMASQLSKSAINKSSPTSLPVATSTSSTTPAQ
jgi:hypothetical protein